MEMDMDMDMDMEMDINKALERRGYPYRLQIYDRIDRSTYAKVRDIGILASVIDMDHSYLVLSDLEDNAVSFIQYEKLNVEGQLVYYIHASGTRPLHRRKNLNVILKIVLCLIGYREDAIYTSSIRGDAFSKPMMTKFGFDFHENTTIEINGIDYYFNVTGVLRNPTIYNNVLQLYDKYLG